MQTHSIITPDVRIDMEAAGYDEFVRAGVRMNCKQRQASLVRALLATDRVGLAGDPEDADSLDSSVRRDRVLT